MRHGAIITFCLGAPAFAMAAANNPIGLDASKQITWNAETVSADIKAETVTLTGNVIVVQGEVKMRADEATLSVPGGQPSRMEARGHVVVDSPSGTAVGDTGIYDVPQQTVHLLGRVALSKDNNVMTGTALDVDMATGVARITGGTAGRVRGVFVPPPKTVAPAKTP
jgi:lipopolysaccharide export system protein LptA